MCVSPCGEAVGGAKAADDHGKQRVHRAASTCRCREGEGGRGLHSSTFRLNVSAFCGIGGAFRGCVGGV